MQQEVHQANRIVSTRLITRIVRDMASDRGLALDEVSWLPDPSEDDWRERRTYTLKLAVGGKYVCEKILSMCLKAKTP